MVGLGHLPGGFGSRATGASAAGSVVVGWSQSGNPVGNDVEAFRWTASGGMVGLGHLPGGDQGAALGVSPDGSIVVGSSGTGSRGFEAFRWTASVGWFDLGRLAGRYDNEAQGVSADGSVVVGFSVSPIAGEVRREAFIWDKVNGMRSLQDVLVASALDLSGWTLSDASGISADGRTIVGTGTNPAGQEEAWIATLTPTAIPEPSSLVLMAIGAPVVVALATAARWTRRRAA